MGKRNFSERCFVGAVATPGRASLAARQVSAQDLRFSSSSGPAPGRISQIGGDAATEGLTFIRRAKEERLASASA
jgi:hypothetical protein